MPVKLQKQNKVDLQKQYMLFLGVFIIGLAPLMLNLIIDPYGFFQEERRGGPTGQFIERAHYPLWKLSRYQQNHHDVFILGDSRARALQEKYWHEYGRKRVFNLAYGGATIPEIYETFKIIKDDPGIHSLIIGIPLRSFNENHRGGLNRVPEAVKLVGRPFEYLKNWSITKTSWAVFNKENSFFSSAFATEQISQSQIASLYKPALNKRVLPKKISSQVKKNGPTDWRNFEFSKTYWEMFKEIGGWARANDKNLIFVIPPTVLEMQQTIADANLLKENHEFRIALSKISLVLDFDTPGELARNLNNFTDAYHFTAKVGRMIVAQILRALEPEQKIIRNLATKQGVIDCFKGKQSGKLIDGLNCRVFRNAVHEN